MIITNAVLQDLRTAFRRTFKDTYEQLRATTFYNRVAYTAPSSTSLRRW